MNVIGATIFFKTNSSNNNQKLIRLMGNYNRETFAYVHERFMPIYKNRNILGT